jgi:predicted dinucleotide-binding enzyme
MRIGILGGTGKLGLARALRLHRSGYEVMIGSPDVSKAVQAARSIGDKINGASNLDVAAQCDTTFIAVPYGRHRALLQPLGEQLRGKVVAGGDARKSEVMELIRSMNLKPINGGLIEFAQHLESEIKITGI